MEFPPMKIFAMCDRKQQFFFLVKVTLKQRSSNECCPYVQLEISGIALDLKAQLLFPAVFDWGQFSDFDLQIKDKLRVRMGGAPLDTEEHHKTEGSTFKPKSLRNRAKARRRIPEKCKLNID